MRFFYVTTKEMETKLTGPAELCNWSFYSLIVAQRFGLWCHINPDAKPKAYLKPPERPDIPGVNFDSMVAALQSQLDESFTRDDPFDEPEDFLDILEDKRHLTPQTDETPNIPPWQITYAEWDKKMGLESWMKAHWEFMLQERAIAAFKSWVKATVSRKIYKRNCLRNRGIRSWYSRLFKKYEPAARALAEEEWQRFFATKAPRDKRKWVLDVRRLTSKATVLKVPAVRDASVWFPQFRRVTKPFMRGVLDAWKVRNAKAFEDGTVRCNDVVLRIEQHFLSERSNEMRVWALGLNKVPELVEAKRKRDLRRKKKHSSNSPAATDVSEDEDGSPVDDPTGQTIPLCWACCRRHFLSTCWYVLPELAPKSWVPSPKVRQLVDRYLARNSDLAAEVKDL